MSKKILAFSAAFLLLGSVLLGQSLYSRKVFLSDFNEGIHFYIQGNFSSARERLFKALKRRPKNGEVRNLLIRVLVEEGLENYRRKDVPQALRSLDQALKLAPQDPEVVSMIQELKARLSGPSRSAPLPMPDLLREIARADPEGRESPALRSQLSRLLEQFQKEQGMMFKTLSQHQEVLMASVHQERSEFRKVLLMSLSIFALGGLFILFFLAFAFQRLFGKRGVVMQMLEFRSQMLASMGGELALEGGRPLLPSLNEEFRKIEAIEAELVTEPDAQAAQGMLRPFLEDEDPWIRARAVKTLYRIDRDQALAELKNLCENSAKRIRLAGIWALGELATLETLELLAPLAWEKDREIQQAAIRSLAQIEQKKQAPPEVLEKAGKILSEIRSKTDWII